MKAKHLLLGLGVTGLLFSCGGGKSYRLTPASMDGIEKGDTITLQDYATGENIDSLVVNDTTFVFEGTADAARAVKLLINSENIGLFVLEPGEMKLNLDTRTVTGTPLNDIDHTTSLYCDSLTTDFKAQRQALYELTDGTAEAKIDSLTDNFQTLLNGRYTEVFEANKTNPLGLIYFAPVTRYGLPLAELNKMLEGTPQWFKDAKPVKKVIKDAESRELTAEGKKFTDFDVTTSEGNTFKLSDVVGKGKFVLVDFWASWCGPCRREIPNIKGIAAKHKDLEVLGIAVWDEPADTKQAVADLEIKWQVIDNAQRIPTDIYGINGIPHIILFGPDGTILSRGEQGEALVEVVDKAMTK